MIVIRDAKKKDLKKCEELSKIEELKTPEGDHPTERYLKAFLNKNLFLVAEFNNEVVGYVAGEILNGNVVYLNCLVVKHELRGKGIGKKLVNKFMKRVMKQKSQMILFFVPKQNERTIRFYGKLGFVKGKEYYFFCKKIKK